MKLLFIFANGLQIGLALIEVNKLTTNKLDYQIIEDINDKAKVLCAFCPTVCSLAKWRKSKHNSSFQHYTLIDAQTFNLALHPPFCQTLVMCLAGNLKMD